MVKVRLFIEGGGSGEIPDRSFRRSWRNFFAAAGLTGKMPKIVRGESRNETFDKFKTALRKQSDGEVTLLLVDSEGPVSDGHSAWQHLKARPSDNWDKPPGAGDDSAYLMVQFMETWFLADLDAISNFFGQNFRENVFQQWQQLESVSKDTVINALERATKDCQKKYRKGRVSFDLLGNISPDRVVSACPHAKELLNYLQSL